MITRPVFIMAILFAIALLMSGLIYMPVFRIAKEKNLVDNPNARKLQKEPVPVMGGLVVFFGIIVGLCFFKTTVNYVNLFSTVCAMMVMLYVGTIDDILDIRAWLKFVIEILLCLLIIYGTRNLMMNFQGLFGISKLLVPVALPLTVIGMVGIINSLNMIDGVDGLCSGMGIFIFGVLGLFLFLAHEYSYCALAVICGAALIPFFIHNVFGRSTKMYIGDGGALMIGVAVSSLIINILKGRGLAYTDFVPDFQRLGLVPFCLSVVSVPVFDALRVMIVRMAHHIPPFAADRRHLHHHLIDDAGFSPIRTSLSEIGLQLLTFVLWFVSYLCGASVTLQFVIVCLVGLASTAGLSFVLQHKK